MTKNTVARRMNITINNADLDNIEMIKNKYNLKTTYLL